MQGSNNKTIDKIDLEETINTEIQKTRKLIEEYKELTQPIAPDEAIGRISRMDAINNKSVTEASLRQAMNKLINLERVLAKKDSEDFGKCLKCGSEIPLGRILIRPESLYCIKCAR